MVGALKRWLKKWLGLDVVEAENLRLARAILAMEKRFGEDVVECERRSKVAYLLLEGRVTTCSGNVSSLGEVSNDHEARIAFCESRLTPKPSEAKIVPKAANWKQFRSAAEKATEAEQEITS